MCDKNSVFDTSTTNSPLMLMCYNDSDLSNFNLTGDFFGDSFNYIKINVKKC